MLSRRSQSQCDLQSFTVGDFPFCLTLYFECREFFSFFLVSMSCTNNVDYLLCKPDILYFYIVLYNYLWLLDDGSFLSKILDMPKWSPPFTTDVMGFQLFWYIYGFCTRLDLNCSDIINCYLFTESKLPYLKCTIGVPTQFVILVIFNN